MRYKQAHRSISWNNTLVTIRDHKLFQLAWWHSLWHFVGKNGSTVPAILCILQYKSQAAVHWICYCHLPVYEPQKIKHTTIIEALTCFNDLPIMSDQHHINLNTTSSEKVVFLLVVLSLSLSLFLLHFLSLPTNQTVRTSPAPPDARKRRSRRTPPGGMVA